MMVWFLSWVLLIWTIGVLYLLYHNDTEGYTPSRGHFGYSTNFLNWMLVDDVDPNFCVTLRDRIAPSLRAGTYLKPFGKYCVNNGDHNPLVDFARTLLKGYLHPCVRVTIVLYTAVCWYCVYWFGSFLFLITFVVKIVSRKAKVNSDFPSLKLMRDVSFYDLFPFVIFHFTKFGVEARTLLMEMPTDYPTYLRFVQSQDTDAVVIAKAATYILKAWSPVLPAEVSAASIELIHRTLLSTNYGRYIDDDLYRVDSASASHGFVLAYQSVCLTDPDSAERLYRIFCVDNRQEGGNRGKNKAKATKYGGCLSPEMRRAKMALKSSKIVMSLTKL